MEITYTILAVLISALSAIGLFSLLRDLGEALLLPRPITAAVVLQEPVDPGELDILLSEARRASWRRRGQGVLLVVSSDSVAVGWTAELAEVAEKYHAEVYAVDMKPR